MLKKKVRDYNHVKHAAPLKEIAIKVDLTNDKLHFPGRWFSCLNCNSNTMVLERKNGIVIIGAKDLLV